MREDEGVRKAAEMMGLGYADVGGEDGKLRMSARMAIEYQLELWVIEWFVLIAFTAAFLEFVSYFTLLQRRTCPHCC